MSRSPYAGPYDRLTRTIHDPDSEQGCWVGTGSKKCRRGYIRFNLYVPGLASSVQMTTHVAMWICVETGATTADELYLYYLEYLHSKLTLDHLCVNPPCRNPDHLEAVTMLENNRRRDKRREKGRWAV